MSDLKSRTLELGGQSDILPIWDIREEIYLFFTTSLSALLMQVCRWSKIVCQKSEESKEPKHAVQSQKAANILP